MKSPGAIQRRRPAAWRRSARMASIVDLAGLRQPSIPKLSLCFVRPSMRPGTGWFGREASAPGPPMPVLCARSLRGASSRWRNGAPGIKKSLPMVRFVLLLQTVDLSTNAGKGLRKRLSRRRRFPKVRVPTTEKACRRSKNCLGSRHDLAQSLSRPRRSSD